MAGAIFFAMMGSCYVVMWTLRLGDDALLASVKHDSERIEMRNLWKAYCV